MKNGFNAAAYSITGNITSHTPRSFNQLLFAKAALGSTCADALAGESVGVLLHALSNLEVIFCSPLSCTYYSSSSGRSNSRMGFPMADVSSGTSLQTIVPMPIRDRAPMWRLFDTRVPVPRNAASPMVTFPERTTPGEQKTAVPRVELCETTTELANRTAGLSSTS